MALDARSAFVVVKSEGMDELRSGPRTFCITGAPRGGTTSVALFLREAGLFMGDTINEMNSEDQRLFVTSDDAEADAVVADYDARHPVWGMKFPQGAKVLRKWVPRLRRPIAMIVLRNPIATARGRMKRGARSAEPETYFTDAMGQQFREGQRMMDWAIAHDGPTLIIEYEKLLADPAKFGSEFVEALGLDVAPDAMARAVASISPGYKAKGAG